ncbi:MAG TPA: shikimate dehydrogenase [Mesorhizobium sp.]|nr:shikimate dehydrogenase [Mesorhizobium sp.]
MFVLAHPIGHVRASAVLNSYFGSTGKDVAASPLHVLPDDLATVIGAIRRMQNVAGFGLTIPHKIAAIPLLDALTEEAGVIGAVNFVRRDHDGRLVGTNTDGAGFVSGLRNNGVDPCGGRILMAGAGGVGRAIAFALAEAGARSIRIMNRDRAKATELARAVAATFPDCAVEPDAAGVGPFDIFVNATSLGLVPEDPLPITEAALAAIPTVAEVVMNPPVTALMRAAARCGARVVPGKAMLDAQMALVAAFMRID